MKSLSHLGLFPLLLFFLVSTGSAQDGAAAGQVQITMPGNAEPGSQEAIAFLGPQQKTHAATAKPGARFKLVYQKKGPRDETREIKVAHQAGVTIFDVRDQFGIGKGTIQLASGTWPAKVLVRLHLAGLEGFGLTIGKKVLARSDLKVRMLDARGKPLPGRYLLKPASPGSSRKIAGYYEVQVPPLLLTAATKEIKLSWVDFYRR
ncbi:MAG: hypothetical protein VX644_16005 [Planctomycetota bacterium]|nr:hypothetical protein [Planctomycetota bacterium]